MTKRTLMKISLVIKVYERQEQQRKHMTHNMSNMTCDTCHMTHVTCHMSYVTCQMSHDISHIT